MNKHEQAQRFAEILLTSGLKGEWDILTDISMFDSIASDAWRMADAMQAEADKRNGGVPEAIQRINKDKDGNCIHLHTTLDCGECFDCGKKLKKEWQPDWSVAPDWANWWAVDSNNKARWIYSELDSPYVGDSDLHKDNRWFSVGRYKSDDAQLFNYRGDWQDSLRKRPEGV